LDEIDRYQHLYTGAFGSGGSQQKKCCKQVYRGVDGFLNCRVGHEYSRPNCVEGLGLHDCEDWEKR
jgi:hypothetical protein